MKKSICNRAKVDVHFSKKQNQTKGNKMAKKFFMAAMAAVLAVTFTACSSISTGTTVHGMKLSDSDVTTVPVHVNGEIWGVYLFGILPLMTGSSAAPGSTTLFKDTVRTAFPPPQRKSGVFDFKSPGSASRRGNCRLQKKDRLHQLKCNRSPLVRTASAERFHAFFMTLR